jgi:hypothetical protein
VRFSLPPLPRNPYLPPMCPQNGDLDWAAITPFVIGQRTSSRVIRCRAPDRVSLARCRRHDTLLSGFGAFIAGIGTSMGKLVK